MKSCWKGTQTKWFLFIAYVKNEYVCSDAQGFGVGYTKTCLLTADPPSGFDLVFFLKTTETQFTGLKSSTREACGLWLCVLVQGFDG